jgi:acyl-CoA thioester hydrolase
VEGFPFVHHEQVRYRDLDAFGHVNNAVFLTYLEEARNAFLAHLGLVRTVADIRMILARTEIDFRSPLGLGEEVDVGVRASRLGTKSFELEYELRSAGRIVAEAKAVLVTYDYEKNAPMPVPDEWRERMAA